MITYDDFKKVEIRAGKILSAEKIPDTDKLLKLTVDFGEYEEVKVAPVDKTTVVSVGDSSSEQTLSTLGETMPKSAEVTKQPSQINKTSKYRQIVSGISLYFPDPAVLIGKTCMFVTNLEPRMIRGYESNGMLFAVSTPEGSFSLLEPNASIPAGTKAA